MTDPADVMRRAAQLMRQRATAAKSSFAGHWYVSTPQGGYPQRIAEDGTVTLVADAFEGPQHPQSIAPFITSMDPAFGLHLAAWFKATADAMDQAIAVREVDLRDDLGNDVPVVISRHGERHHDWTTALAAARHYLGEAPDA